MLYYAIFRNRPAALRQPYASKNLKHHTWYRFENKFLTLAAELCEDAKWQDLIKKLKSTYSSSPDQLESADNRD